ncbi:hypothetical protein MKX03_018658 [Papaver bracteatum]|nr:hypothetical protein MKX03_018658 [Papaver bracteatum]
MKGVGVSCNQNSFASVVSSCGTFEDHLFGCQVLAHITVSGFGSNISVANALIQMFGSCGDVKNADCVFHRMLERDTISQNHISILSERAFSVDNLRWGMVIRSLILKLGLDSIVCIQSSYLMSDRDLISWHSMMVSSVQNGHHRNAPELPVELCRTSKVRDHVTFASAFSCMSSI